MSSEFELGPRLKSINLNSKEHVIWPGAMRNGYGVKKIPGGTSTINAHRYVWERYYGKKIPKGMAIDHKCRERRCINPRHLELVSSSENKKRAWAAAKGNWDDKKGSYKVPVKKVDSRLSIKPNKTAPLFNKRKLQRRMTITPLESRKMTNTVKKPSV